VLLPGPVNVQIESDFYDKGLILRLSSVHCAPAMGGVAESLRKARLSAGSGLVSLSNPYRIFTAIPIAYGSALIAVACVRSSPTSLATTVT
jgi:hypothetical protein